MSKQIRNLGAFFMVCYLALFVQLNRFAFFESENLVEDDFNHRERLRDFGAPRGSIVTADGELVAFSTPSNEELQLPETEGQRDDCGLPELPTSSDYEQQRVYPWCHLYSHITGYFSVGGQPAGLEDSYGGKLSGRDLGFDLATAGDYFFDDERVGNITLTVDHNVQTLARDQLGDRNGSVVVLNPRSGAILGMYSNPTYDPNAMAVHDIDQAAGAHELLEAAEGQPLLGRTYQQIFFPGSTFKVVTAAAGLASGSVAPEQPVYPTEQSYTPPRSTRPISNYGNPPSNCGGTLFEILAQSCNTSFMRMAADPDLGVGGEQMAETAADFGFNERPPIDLPNPAPSTYPPAESFEFNEALLALSAIGQGTAEGETKATPLQMALVAAAVANEGEVPTPHVVSEVRDNDGNVLEEHNPGSWRTAVDDDVAETLYDAMLGVVENGTAGTLREGLDGLAVGGKTGTAQIDQSRSRSHAWIIGFAGPPGEVPEIAVAVLVEAQEGASEQTGGSVAAPIAAAVMREALAAQGQPEA